MRVLLVSALMLLTLRVQAAHGIVVAAGGSKLEGEIQFENGGFTITNSEATNRIELANLVRLRFQPPADTNTLATNSTVSGRVTPTNGLLGLYYNEPDHTGAFKIRYDATIDFDWGE